MSADLDAAFEQLGREVADQLTKSMDEHVDHAEELLADDDLTAFALVAIREDEHGTQSASQRVVDPEAVRDDDRDPEAAIDAYHEAICHVFDQEVRDR